MPAHISKGRLTPAKTVATTDTALPGAAPVERPARTLSGAFAGAIGNTPQSSQMETRLPLAATGKKPMSDLPGVPRPKNSKPGAPSVPRKGHR